MRPRDDVVAFPSKKLGLQDLGQGYIKKLSVKGSLSLVVAAADGIANDDLIDF